MPSVAPLSVSSSSVFRILADFVGRRSPPPSPSLLHLLPLARIRTHIRVAVLRASFRCVTNVGAYKSLLIHARSVCKFGFVNCNVYIIGVIIIR